MKQVISTIVRVLGAQWFWYGVLGLFIIQALWIALSAVYPLPFDEEFHVGLTQLYTNQWLPILSSQPPGTEMLDAVTRDVSVLYYYLMSFPYRLLELFTDNQVTIIIVLRCLNIALFAWGLVLFRRLLLRSGLSAAFTHTALALFTLIPIVPQLAAHINYDNVIFTMVALGCLWVARVLDGLAVRKLDVWALGALLLLCFVMGLTKYKALPIVLAIVLLLGFSIYRTFHRASGGFGRAAKRAWLHGFGLVSRRARIGFVVLFVLLFGLFIQRYGANLVSYQSLKPSCDKVLGEERCMAYGPWARNHLLAEYQEARGGFDPQPLAFVGIWLQSLHYRSFFAISGLSNNYQNFPPLPLPAGAAIGIMIIGLGALALTFRRVFRGQPLLVFFLVLCVIYIGTLLIDNYNQYASTGHPVAINGRYLLLVLLPLVAIFGRALSLVLRPLPAAKAALAVVVILLFLQGGGVLSFILRSEPSWFWANPTIVEKNDAVRQVLAPVIVEGSKRY